MTLATLNMVWLLVLDSEYIRKKPVGSSSLSGNVSLMSEDNALS